MYVGLLKSSSVARLQVLPVGSVDGIARTRAMYAAYAAVPCPTLGLSAKKPLSTCSWSASSTITPLFVHNDDPDNASLPSHMKPAPPMPSSSAPFMNSPASLAWQKMTMMRACDLASSRYWSVNVELSLAKLTDASTVRPRLAAAERKAEMPAAPYPSVDATLATLLYWKRFWIRSAKPSPWNASLGGVRKKYEYVLPSLSSALVEEYEICGTIARFATSAADIDGPDDAAPTMALTPFPSNAD